MDEKEAIWVEKLKIAFEGAAGLGDAWGNFVVEFFPVKMVALQHPDHGGSDFGDLGRALVVLGGGDRRQEGEKG